MEFYNPLYIPPSSDGNSYWLNIEKIKIVPEWTCKAIGNERFENTHAELFTPIKNKYSTSRALKLRSEETKGRRFDIISGVSNDLDISRFDT